MAAIVYQYDKRVDITYAYESISHWDTEKKQSRATRKLIGIVDPVTKEILPTTKKKRVSKKSTAKEEKNWLDAKRTFCGATYLFDLISNETGVLQDLRICFPETYTQILSIAYFLILEDRNPLSRFPKWCKLHTHPYGDEISSQRSSDLFADISESQRLHFFQLQGQRRIEKEYWAYDTTSISSYSNRLRQVRYGVNKDYDPLPQINLALLYGEESRLPFFYRKLPGNISDVSTVKQLLKELDFLEHKKIKLVMDRGFYSEANINALLSEHLKFLIGVKISLKYVQKEIDGVREQIRTMEHYIGENEVYGMTVPFRWKYRRSRAYKHDEIQEDRRMYLHIYFDPAKAVEDEKELTKLVCRLKEELETGSLNLTHKALYEKYFDTKTTPIRGQKVSLKEEIITATLKNNGYFALISNEAGEAAQALNVYRNKDVVEKAFDSIKDRLAMRRFNVSSDLSLEGKLFVEFIALIHISYLHKAMQQANLYKKFTMYELLDELELIERFDRMGHKPQYSEITKKQLQILAALNFPPPNSSL